MAGNETKVNGNENNVRYLSIFSDMMKKYQEKCKSNLDGYSFTPNETAMMVFMLKNPETDTARDIAKCLGISQSLICRSVDSLTKKGFIKVSKDREDRRINHLHLKIQDEELRRTLLSMDGNFENTMMNGVDENDLNIFRRVVVRMAENVGISNYN